MNDIKFILPKINISTPLVPGEIVMVKSTVAEVPHTLTGSGQLIPLEGYNSSQSVHSEPSRLKIAAMILAGINACPNLSHSSNEKAALDALRQTDALIALAKEMPTTR